MHAFYLSLYTGQLLPEIKALALFDCLKAAGETDM